MSDGPAGRPKPEAERILDEMLEDLSDFFQGEFKEDVREFVLDAIAAHPVTRKLAARVDERSAPERSGEQVDEAAGELADKASGDDER
jgi:hypothetical protein